MIGTAVATMPEGMVKGPEIVLPRNVLVSGNAVVNAPCSLGIKRTALHSTRYEGSEGASEGLIQPPINPPM